MESEASQRDPRWGRALLAFGCQYNAGRVCAGKVEVVQILYTGGLGWATNGLKDRPKGAETDLISPTVLRSLCNIKAVKVLTGPSANYAIILDVYGAAYLIGKMPTTAYGKAGLIHDRDAIKLSAEHVGSSAKGAKFVAGACARSHCLLVDDQGEVWGCGNNVVGQLGLPITGSVDAFTRISGPWEKDPSARVVAVSTGNMFTLFLTNDGRVYSSGYGEYGQLGNGTTGERILKSQKRAFDIETPPKLIKGLQGKKITQIASGSNHSLALDDEGYVYAWGHAGYSRLGLQDQVDKLNPTLIAQFAGKNPQNRAKAVYCGPTSSVVIEQNGRYNMAGKWKTTGDGGVGQPYTSFKPIQDISSRKVMHAALGGCTHFITCPSDDEGETMTIGFGQGVLYGELGLNDPRMLSSSKPVRIEALDKCEVVDIGAAAFFTAFIVEPNDAFSEFAMWPAEIATSDLCCVCFEDRPKSPDPVECEKCNEGYHFECLDPPLLELPEEDWFCPECQLEGEGGLEQPFRPGKEWSKAKKPGWRERKAALEFSSSLDNIARLDESNAEREGSVTSHSSRPSKKSRLSMV